MARGRRVRVATHANAGASGTANNDDKERLD
jgi:hypothetical protein